MSLRPVVESIKLKMHELIPTKSLIRAHPKSIVNTVHRIGLCTFTSQQCVTACMCVLLPDIWWYDISYT